MRSARKGTFTPISSAFVSPPWENCVVSTHPAGSLSLCGSEEEWAAPAKKEAGGKKKKGKVRRGERGMGKEGEDGCYRRVVRWLVGAAVLRRLGGWVVQLGGRQEEEGQGGRGNSGFRDGMRRALGRRCSKKEDGDG